MVVSWRALGLSLLLFLAAACSTPTTEPRPTTRPSFTPPAAHTATAPAVTPTELGQASTTAPAVPTSTVTPAEASTPDPAATPDAAATEATAPPEGTVTAIVTATPTPTEPGQAGGPCTNDVAYIADLSVPDGTAFQPGEPLLKQWSVRNAGTCDWDAGYRLVLVSGNALGARSELALYPARAGLEAIIEVPMIAPAEPGSYTGRWQARDPAGNVFGDRIFITIQVVPPATPTETTTPTP